jgi:hypothetical protein
MDAFVVSVSSFSILGSVVIGIFPADQANQVICNSSVLSTPGGVLLALVVQVI